MRFNILGEEGSEKNTLIVELNRTKTSILGFWSYLYVWFRLFPLPTTRLAKTGARNTYLMRRGLAVRIFLCLPRFWHSRILFDIFDWKEISGPYWEMSGDDMEYHRLGIAWVLRKIEEGEKEKKLASRKKKKVLN